MKGPSIFQVRGFPFGCIHMLPVPRLAAHGAPWRTQWGDPQLRCHVGWWPPPE